MRLINIGIKKIKILIIILILIIIIFIINLLKTLFIINEIKDFDNKKVDKSIDKTIDKTFDKTFDELIEFNDNNSNNITGFDRNIVPNIVHYVRFENPFIDFITLVSIKSVLKNQKPLKIIIHCDCDSLKGKYWDSLQVLNNTQNNGSIFVNKISKPKFIFGKKLSSVYHMSDIARLQILMSFGGIFLDNDVFVVKSIDFFRKFEFAIGWPPNESLGN
jgi:mannosyltransferase OCH1-like enzyme